MFVSAYLIYEEPRESLSLVLSVYFILKILNRKKENDDYYRSLKKDKIIFYRFLAIALSYVLVQVFISFNMQEIDLNIEQNYIDREEKAILLVYEGEAEKYNLNTQTRNISLNGSIFKKINKILALNDSKRFYNKIGKSDYRKKVGLVKDKLSKVIDKEKYTTYVGYLNDSKHVKETLVEIVNDGHREVIVVPIFIKNDKYYKAIKKTIDEMQLFNKEVSIKYTESFGISEGLVEGYMEKIDSEINEVNLSSTGIILIGSGEEPLEEELLFRGKVEEYLHKFLKIENNKIKKAWFSNTKPGYLDEIKDLLELGVSDIIIIYTEPGLTNRDNHEIYRNISKNISFPEGVKTKIIDGFLTEDKLIEEIKKQIEILEIIK